MIVQSFILIETSIFKLQVDLIHCVLRLNVNV